LGALAGGQFNSMATAVSGDGSVIVGWSGAVGSQMAFRWTAGTGMTAIPLASTGRGALAAATSADGSVVVGEMFRTTSGVEAFRWSAPTGMATLGAFSTGGSTMYSYAQGVSADGNMVIGYSTTPNGQEAFFWTPQGGMVNLLDALTAAGADTTGWLLSYAYAVSADGRFIVGQGLHFGHTEAWAAHLPRVCYANCDASTTPPVLGVGDFVCFLNRFAAGDSYANCDGSTVPPVLNVNDFTCFLNAFAAGCP
jgi:probable HAF family extracellular repeat protein